MNDKYFLDTNIFVYSFDKSNPAKQRQALDLINRAIKNECGCISYQVVQEFLNVATQKFEIPLKEQDAILYMSKILEPLCEIFPDFALFQDALEIKQSWKYSFYDSLIISAAIRSHSKILYTEDLQHGQRIRDLRIENPFL